MGVLFSIPDVFFIQETKTQFLKYRLRYFK